MSHPILATLIGALSLMTALGQAQAQPQTNGPCNVPALTNQQKDAATIRHLETSWNTAITQGDAAFEDCLLTADFMEILSNGELKTRTDELSFTTKNKGQHKPLPQLPPFTIVIHGDVAMAHATWTTTTSKRPPDKIVDYFIWENGAWHVFFSQSTPIEAQKKVGLRWLALFDPGPTRAQIHPNEIPAGVLAVPSPLLGNTRTIASPMSCSSWTIALTALGSLDGCGGPATKS